MNGELDIFLDGRPRRIASGTSLQSLMDQMGLDPADVATAVNGEFVSRAARADHLLQGGDSVMLFRAIVGG
jgi:sulfur carrier protein